MVSASVPDIKIGQKTDASDVSVEVDWNGLTLVDLPGYGTEKFPKETYFEKFDILQYDLFVCVFSGKFLQADNEFFQELKKQGKKCIFVRNKHDDIWDEIKTTEELEKEICDDFIKQIKSSEKIIFTSCRLNYGLKELSTAILSHIDTTKRSKWIETAKAYSKDFLEKKKKLCDNRVTQYAALAAANGLNPIPGTDIAIDLAIMINLFDKIREIFGLTNKILQNDKYIKPAIAGIANNILKVAQKEGANLLLKKIAPKVAIKEFAKYAPIVGQLASASIGFAITKTAGDNYLNDSYKIAQSILDVELGTDSN